MALNDFTSELKTWYAAPFKTEMSVTNWFLFLGMLIVLMGVWRIILDHIAGDFERG